MAKVSGTCKWFNSTKGFGFLIPADGSEEIFVHQTEIKASGFRNLGEGEVVEYVPAVDSNGRPKATQVTAPGGGDVTGAQRRYHRGPRQPKADRDGSAGEGAGGGGNGGGRGGSRRRRGGGRGGGGGRGEAAANGGEAMATDQ